MMDCRKQIWSVISAPKFMPWFASLQFTSIEMERCLRIGLLIIVGWLGQPAVSFGQKTEDQVFLDGLRTRQLFELAETYVTKRLSEGKISATEEGNLIIELMRIRMDSAIQARGSNREAIWKAAVAAGNDFIKNRNHPRELVIRVQMELVRLTQGKFLAQQLAAGISGTNLQGRAIQEISNARRGLEKIDREITLAVPQAPNGSDGLTAEELRSLQKNVQYQIASCNLQAARLFPEDDRDNRIGALLQVVQRLDQVASQTNSAMPLWWSVQVDRMEALRLQGKISELNDVLKKLSTKEILNSDLRRSDVLRQQVELLLERNQGDGERLLAAANLIKQPTADLDLSLVRLMMHTGENADQQRGREKWQRAANRMAKLIGQRHGRFWGRLAELAVIGGGAKSATTELDILLGIADEAWRQGNLEDAVKAFDRAYSQAVTDGNEAIAMSAGMKAAKVFEQQGQHREAGNRLIRVATSHLEQEASSAAHLAGCWNIGRAAAKEKSLSEEYAAQLEDHIANWPTASSVAQARIWLGRYQGAKKNWREAFRTLIGVPVDSRLLFEAAKLLPVVASARISELKRHNEPILGECTDLSQQMFDKLNQAGIGPNDRWTDATRQLLLASTQFSMQHEVGDPLALSRLLKRAMSESDDASDGWKRSATAWLVVVKAAQSETLREALELADGLSGFDEGALAECFDGVAKVRSVDGLAQRNELKLKLIEFALAQSIRDPAAQGRWLSRKSTLLVELGRGGEAIGMLNQLIEDNPRRADLQIALAKALTGAEGKTEEALLQWRRVASKSKPQSRNWFEAKYYVAKQLIKSGKSDDAKKLLDYLKVIPPGWEDSHLKAEFDRLHSELD